MNRRSPMGLGSPTPRIVVDAGHGGQDSGAVGPGGAEEKDVALAVARCLRKELAGWAWVAETRMGDYFVPLGERTALANKTGADLFVSIHCNASEGHDAEGMEVWRYRTSERGEECAEAVCNALATEFPAHKRRGVKRGGFLVLRRTRMPAILVECEFIDTPEGEKFLTNKAVQLDLAKAVARGVRRWWLMRGRFESGRAEGYGLRRMMDDARGWLRGEEGH